MLETVRKALMALTLIVMAVAVFGLYMAINTIIDYFIYYRYAPIYKALMNLAVIVLSIYVLNIMLQERRGDSEERKST